MTRNTLRKAAILIASLDTHSADALLDEMAPEEAARVRNAVMELGDVDPQEQQQIMRDFVGHHPHVALPDEPAVELDPSLVEKLQARAARVEPDPPLPCAENRGTPFSFLDHIDAADLAQVLIREHPQTTAIVISHLPPARAADVLRRLPNSLQSEALIRIARLKTLATDVVRDIEHEMQALLRNRRQLEPVVPHGLAAIQAILLASSVSERQELLAELVRHDQTLARHFGDALPTTTPPTSADSAPGETLPPTPVLPAACGDRRKSTDRLRAAEEGGNAVRWRILTFADLERLEDAALAQVLHLSSPNTALLALAGASHDFVMRILRQLPSREAGQLERKMRQLGPLRLDDVERAQLRLVEMAQRLIDEGRIALPQVERFAVAA
jgi:flagellar motor switch protein FliG